MHMANTKKNTPDPCEVVLKQILKEVAELRQEIEIKADLRLQKYQHNYPSGAFSKSACNLAHYLAMRQFDLRDLQDRLAQASLTSLGRAEASVLSTLDALIDVLKRATDKHYICRMKKSPANTAAIRGSSCWISIRLNYLAPFMNTAGRMLW